MSIRIHARAPQRRGQPLIALAVLAPIWIGARIAFWEAPWPTPSVTDKLAAAALAARESQPPDAPETVTTEHFGKASAHFESGISRPAQMAQPFRRNELVTVPPQSSTLAVAGHYVPQVAAPPRLPLISEVDRHPSLPPQPEEGAATADRKLRQADRWSLDAWALWREGSGSAMVSQGRMPTYGASQAGAVLRYRLSPGNLRDPHAYLRAYRALVRDGESEIAAGFSGRPIAKVPLRAHLEFRVTEFARGTALRPAAFVTTELPTARLPAGLRAETYLQAGYVAGEASTAFADGQLHLLTDVHRFGSGKLSLGMAAWGGAQEGAERVDLGPSVRLDFSIDETPARISLDYRERVAGDAEPPSGVAITLSTRF